MIVVKIIGATVKKFQKFYILYFDNNNSYVVMEFLTIMEIS